jgi:hypothetical protein
LARAERRVPARDANVEIDRERTRQQIAHGRALSYEVVIEPGRGFAWLATEVAPRLAQYLGNKKIPPLRCHGVFLPVFAGDELYFLEGPTFFDAVREAEGLDDAAWRVRVRTWELFS